MNLIKIWLIRLAGITLILFFIFLGFFIGLTGPIKGTPESVKKTQTLIKESRERIMIFLNQKTNLIEKKPLVKVTQSLSESKVILEPTLNLQIEGAYLGVCLPGIPGPLDNLIKFENQIGKNVALVHWFQAWAGENKEFKEEFVQTLWGHGTIVMISWEPWERTKDYQKPQPDFRLSNIEEGKFDPYIKEWARKIKKFGNVILIRFGHEMDGNWNPWSIGMNGNKEEDYVAAWKHIHNIFKEEGCDNVQWVWSPNWNAQWPANRYKKIYPGDEYVDWIGMSIFNWGTTVPRHKWDSLEDRLDWRYQRAIGYNKPIILAEFATDETGGSKSEWIIKSFKSLKENYPQVRAIVWFNFPNARYSSKVQWAIDSSPEALKSFQEAIKDPYFLGPQLVEENNRIN